MKSVEFCYWLQGMFELSKPQSLTPEQTELIKRHLAMVFKHEIDPSYPEGQQQALSGIHQHPWPDLNQSATIPANPNVLVRC